ncbi:hypothetical protein [Eilatimonas milleporae]|nr:hypothetical protein [Eilatimonas milleporae]
MDRPSDGLHKAIVRRLAEADATEEEIAAILGDSVRTAAIYTGAGLSKLDGSE